MPKKYHLKVNPAPARFAPISKFSGVEIEGCLGCLVCVKRVSCVYDVYKNRKFDPIQVSDSADVQCVTCMRCVQECKKNILGRVRNPAFEHLGDDYWKPDIVTSIWKQAETGKIPVSGAGYRGRFYGPGFDSIWTDMSEIVRPTRDGIHGREYISTLIDMGHRPSRLVFGDDGTLLTEAPRILELPLPIVLDAPPLAFIGKGTLLALAEAAGRLETLMFATAPEAARTLKSHRHCLIVRFDPACDSAEAIEQAPAIELDYSPKVLDEAAKLKKSHPQAMRFVRVPFDEQATSRAIQLAEGGVDVIHLVADRQGKGGGARSGRFITDLVRETHLGLVGKAWRDRVTILVSGGMAMAEHVAKIIICGADGVVADLALMAAMECRLCTNCRTRSECPVRLDTVPVKWGAQRIVNLMGSWHSQLIEVMGAMGLREARRLRGEVGRAMFFEDLERESFAPVFGERIKTEERPV
jgi:ferredoxin